MTDPFEFLVRGDVGAAVDAVTGLDDQGRRSFADGLVAHVRRRRDNWWWNNEATALAVAAVGCLPTAATAAELLGRRNVSLRGAGAGLVVQVARTRGVPWLAELAYRLADRLRRDDPMDGWGFVAELLTAEKAAPPTGDQFVEGWLALMAWPPEWQRPVPLVDRLRADVFLDALVPRLFEVDGAGTRMSFDEFMTDEKLALPRALARLAGEGRLDRTMLLDGCVSRLLRGDRPAALRAFVALHALLEPTASEADRHRGDYLRLLADAPGPVASMAQKTLRALDDVEVEGLLDASRAVLVRPDKALVRAQLGWLDQLARRHPDRAAEIAEVIATAVDHPAADVRDRAGTLAARHGHVVAPRVVVGAVGDDLPPPAGPLPRRRPSRPGRTGGGGRLPARRPHDGVRSGTGPRRSGPARRWRPGPAERRPDSGAAAAPRRRGGAPVGSVLPVRSPRRCCTRRDPVEGAYGGDGGPRCWRRCGAARRADRPS
ncbi:DUF6493 family protein, partial [Micromonospora sp. 4G55]|uniref:DUF6493 family protein n=1 Tax=Micromonospora sp. 4G55 TaxID=2806102 RepID=UPI001A40C538